MPMYCTDCGKDTGVEPEFTSLTTEQKIDLCHNWLCNDCLSYVEEEQKREEQRARQEEALSALDDDDDWTDFMDKSAPY